MERWMDTWERPSWIIIVMNKETIKKVNYMVIMLKLTWATNTYTMNCITKWKIHKVQHIIFNKKTKLNSKIKKELQGKKCWSMRKWRAREGHHITINTLMSKTNDIDHIIVNIYF